MAATGFVGSLFSGQAHAQGVQSSLTFTELTRIYDQTHHVAEGYKAEVVAAWGDAMQAGQAAFDAKTLTAADQAARFGYNADFIAYMPLPRGSQNSDTGLLCVNNEYVSFNVMFDDLPDDGAGGAKMTAAGGRRFGHLRRRPHQIAHRRCAGAVWLRRVRLLWPRPVR